ncbi:MAG: hypothetical protein H6709_05485 [Kofleriaceae bacterium]|nr:hypothetical protein [Myxococcales bacterium]MCB9559910.1 hypothetical protein [Kofleriaceae bacterium]MCB9571524.1 hypothetical protein [Kofleriaceae bacterium]
MKPLSTILIACAAITLGVTSPARADAPGVTAVAGDAPAPTPRYMWTIGGLLRSTVADPDASRAADQLEAYGYRAEPPVMHGLRGDLAYLRAPIVDVGVAWAWARGGWADGPVTDDPDHVAASTLELGGFARMHWVRRDFPVAAEPRVEAGLARTSVELRGVAARRLVGYTRVGLDFRAGARKAGVMLSVDYSHVGTAGGDMLELPTGGLSVALSFYWRDWQAGR